MRTAALLASDPTPDGGSDSRAALVERWLLLTRHILPAMAEEERWPIRFDHCFMRVCLDDAMGRPWTEVLRRPAIVTMSDAQLAAAVRTAESIVERPETLPVLNERSLQWRRAARSALIPPHVSGSSDEGVSASGSGEPRHRE